MGAHGRRFGCGNTVDIRFAKRAVRVHRMAAKDTVALRADPIERMREKKDLRLDVGARPLHPLAVPSRADLDAPIHLSIPKLPELTIRQGLD